jgi:hypothetical protein
MLHATYCVAISPITTTLCKRPVVPLARAAAADGGGGRVRRRCAKAVIAENDRQLCGDNQNRDAAVARHEMKPGL